MSQNTSHAVMQQRHEAHDSLDDFPTPPWATRALIETIIKPYWEGIHDLETVMLKQQTVWEPACNRGYMVRPLREYFGDVVGSDIHHYGGFDQHTIRDFLFPDDRSVGKFDWIITNPPFRLAAQFALRCIQLKPRKGFALLVRTSFLEGRERHETLFKPHPPTHVAQFVERVPMVKGRHDPEASTATSYAWLVWSEAHSGTQFVWIPPCRRQLQKESDAADNASAGEIVVGEPWDIRGEHA